MLFDVQGFRQRVRYDLDGLVEDLQVETRRCGGAEAIAWRNSLPALSEVLSHESLGAYHVEVGRPADLAVEYRLPASASWVDAVVLGHGRERPAAVFVELKDWDTRGDAAGPREGLVRHAGRELLHPADQVRGYVEYCQRFHSAVQAEAADVAGCVFFTYASWADPYSKEPHAELVEQYPVFARNELDLTQRFPGFLRSRLSRPDAGFSQRFVEGSYHQDRGFVLQVSAAIADPRTSPFVLLDEQRTGFQKVMKEVERVVAPARARVRRGRRAKSVVLVEGPPGSGKSVIAAQLWAALAADERIDGNVVLTTTSSAQRSNWEGLFQRAAEDRAARGVVVPANRYNPGLSPQWVNRERAKGERIEVSTWRENLERFASRGLRDRCPDDSFAVSIVDEAHALIDPTVEGKEGVAPSGWSMHAGPQAWHVIRSSRVSVFLLDGEQSYRDNETTTRASLEAYAKEFGVDEVELVSLEGAQFRCGGAFEYMSWLDAALGLGDRPSPPSAWRLRCGGPFELEIVETPLALESALQEQRARGRSVRLLASYARRWKSKGALAPHALPPAERDFLVHCDGPGGTESWSRIWNYAPEQDYTLFIQAPPGSYMAEDPLAEVGCPYVVRGFDFDYVGLLWLSDLVWRGDRWEVLLEHVHESAWRKTRARARAEGGRGPATEELLQRLQRGYRILLSRALRGAFVWFEDAETRAHIERLLASER